MNWEFLSIVGIPLGRSLFGWLENAIEDKKIDPVEWKQLISTTVRIGTPAVLLWLGFGMDATAAASIAAVLDIFVHKLV